MKKAIIPIIISIIITLIITTPTALAQDPDPCDNLISPENATALDYFSDPTSSYPPSKSVDEDTTGESYWLSGSLTPNTLTVSDFGGTACGIKIMVAYDTAHQFITSIQTDDSTTVYTGPRYLNQAYIFFTIQFPDCYQTNELIINLENSEPDLRNAVKELYVCAGYQTPILPPNPCGSALYERQPNYTTPAGGYNAIDNNTSTSYNLTSQLTIHEYDYTWDACALSLYPNNSGTIDTLSLDGNPVTGYYSLTPYQWNYISFSGCQTATNFTLSGTADLNEVRICYDSEQMTIGAADAVAGLETTHGISLPYDFTPYEIGDSDIDVIGILDLAGRINSTEFINELGKSFSTVWVMLAMHDVAEIIGNNLIAFFVILMLGASGTRFLWTFIKAKRNPEFHYDPEVDYDGDPHEGRIFIKRY